MKRKLLTSILSLPIVATCMTTVVACGNNSTQKTSLSLSATTKCTVSFEAHEGEDVTFIGNTKVKVEVGSYFASVVAPSAYRKGYPVLYWTDIDGNEITPKTIIEGNLTVYPHFEEVKIENCIGMTAISDSTISINHYGNSNPNIQYSLDGRKFDKYDQKFVTLKSGESVYFRGDNAEGFSTSTGDYTSFSIGGAVSLSGNVMTLIDNGLGDTDAIPCSYCFYRLFENCSGIVSISSNLLPATKLKSGSYAFMFDGCTNLTDFPKTLLPAKYLYQGETYPGTVCYQGMFANCTGLKTLPVGLLEAEVLSPYCYYKMFENCTGLTKLEDGVLPATIGPEVGLGCYINMFDGCSGITEVGNILPSQTLAPSCYYSMFKDCSGITDLSNLTLPATQLQDSCYGEMFYNCTNLVTGPTMNGETLADKSYYSMFYNCQKLTTIDPFPSGHTYTLANQCCQRMFTNCSALTTMPSMPEDATTELKDECFSRMFENSGITSVAGQLPYTTLAPLCYEYMFYNCKGLTETMERLPAMELKDSCYLGMFQNCEEIITPPILPAQTPALSCYNAMFYGCKKIKPAAIGIIHFTEDSLDCFSRMYENCSSLQISYTQQEGYKLLIIIPGAIEGMDISKFCSLMFEGIQTAPKVTPDYGDAIYYKE